jgi:hypothetical protein
MTRPRETEAISELVRFLYRISSFPAFAEKPGRRGEHASRRGGDLGGLARWRLGLFWSWNAGEPFHRMIGYHASSLAMRLGDNRARVDATYAQGQPNKDL